MKIIEGFHINKVKKGTKKGQEYVYYGKRFKWRIPERLEGQIEKGDTVIVHCKAQKMNRDIKAKVLVVDILESEERPLRSVIEIVKKNSLQTV